MKHLTFLCPWFCPFCWWEAWRLSNEPSGISIREGTLKEKREDELLAKEMRGFPSGEEIVFWFAFVSIFLVLVSLALKVF